MTNSENKSDENKESKTKEETTSEKKQATPEKWKHDLVLNTATGLKRRNKD